MKLRALVAIALVAGAGVLAWRTHLVDVSRSTEARPLALAAAGDREAVAFDVTLPAVPVGMARLASGGHARLVHYWAPWERDAKAQIAALDSLDRALGDLGPEIVVVCFDPYPSVARFVARHKLRVRVVLDHERRLERALACPELPFTYVLDAGGRVAVAQGGPVAWLDPRTVELVRALAAETQEPAPVATPS
jgi:peroxiredoxin